MRVFVSAPARSLSLALALAGGPAWAQMAPDEFVRQAAADNIADVEAGRLAQAATQAPQSVQQLGRQISLDSTEFNGRLAKIAQQKNIALTNQIPPQDRQALQQLSQLQGTDFTRGYLRYVIADLEHDQAMYREAVRSPDETIAQFAREALPRIQNQLMTARAVHDAQVAATPGAGVGGPAGSQPGE